MRHFLHSLMQMIAQFFTFDTGIIKLKIEFNNSSPFLPDEDFINFSLIQFKLSKKKADTCRPFL